MNNWTPNSDQIQGVIRALLSAGGPLAALLISKGATADQVNQIETIALAVVPPLIALIWSIVTHKQDNTIIAASKVPGAEVHIDPAAASPKLIEIAKPDSKYDNVVLKQ